MRRLDVQTNAGINRHFNAGVLDEAYQAFHGRWDESREEIAAGLTRIADILMTIREAFAAADEQLAAQLSPATSGGS